MSQNNIVDFTGAQATLRQQQSDAAEAIEAQKRLMADDEDDVQDDFDEDDETDVTAEVEDGDVTGDFSEAFIRSKSSHELMIADLKKSGLTTQDIDVQIVDQSIATLCNCSPSAKGYAIRYRMLDNKFSYFYRVRLFEGRVKYKQQKGEGNSIYFTKDFYANFERMGKKLIILTEGEKKAAALAKLGFPVVAVTGVDSWRNNIITIPKGAVSVDAPGKKNESYVFKLQQQDFLTFESTSGVAKGFDDVINLVTKYKCQFVICYDLDTKLVAVNNVQRAAAKLGFEMRNRGIPVTSIRQMYLTRIGVEEKTALDDFLVAEAPHGGLEKFKFLLNECLQKENAFPHYPNIREYLAKQLGKPRLNRKMYQQASLALVTDLDRRGKRMFSPGEEQLYYFDRQTKHLMKVNINDPRGNINESEFGRLLYNEYDIAPQADQKLMAWFGAQISAEGAIEHVNPSRIIARPKEGEDCVRYQLNDGQFIKVTGDPKKPFQILDNGADSTLFSSGTQLPVNGEELAAALAMVSKQPLKPWWFDVLREVKLKEHGNHAKAMGLLYYISPWLYRWRGTQLPIEMVCGESGSGKSTLVSLRLNILTGTASLKNAPSDLKDWYATITKSGGMHVTDNLHFTDKQLAQRMSDELCRLVTEPEPAIEQRKYFTNADVIKFPINAIFSFTAIKQPFQNADLIQRSFILELDKTSDLQRKTDANELMKDFAFDSNWLQYQMERFGGRVMWIAHHIWVLHKFFALMKQKWDPKYKARYRLINLEQIMMFMAEVFNEESSWIPEHLSTVTNKTIASADWTLEGLKAFADHWRKHQGNNEFKASQIVDFANSHESFEDCQMLTNTRSLGRYLQTAKFNIATIAGIQESSNKGNVQYYKVTKLAPI